MSATIVAASLFALLLGLEWRYRLRSARVAAALLSLFVLFFAAPGYTRAARWALEIPPAERVTQIRGHPLSEYVTGVRTMEYAVGEDAKMGANVRLIALGVLVWLACSPIIPRKQPPPPKGATQHDLHVEIEH